VNVYSLLAKAQPTVSTPVTWKEVETVVKKGTSAAGFSPAQRSEAGGDLFAPLLTLRQCQPSLRSITAATPEPA
jgi:bifunctional non-homologous end joining protein LigD